MAKFMPAQYSGSVLKYLVGNDTCVLEAGKLSLSKSYEYKSNCGGDHCEVKAIQKLGKRDMHSIDYIQQYEHYIGLVKLDILIGGEGCQKNIGKWWVSYDFEDTGHAQQHDYEILPEYISATGKIYSQVLFYHYSKDSIWVAYDEGLIRYVPGQTDTTALGQVWQLL